MYQPPPFRGRSVFDDKKVLLIDPHQRAREVRARVLRSRGIEVDATDSLQAARSLWRPRAYDLILLDARGHLPGEARDFYLAIKHASPRERVILLVGPPTYLSLTWPTEVVAVEKEPQQWAETVGHYVTAA
jgi:DNA-binding NtrC family response regulator